MADRKTIIVGAGMAGLAAAISLSAKGEEVVLLERQDYPGGKMRAHNAGGLPIDAGPTVLTMKWVFERLFNIAGTNLYDAVQLKKATVLARHAWDDTGTFDLFADQQQSEDEIARIFGGENAAGYRRFCSDSKAIFDTLKDTFISAPRPSPIELGRRVGLLNFPSLLSLRPFHTLWRALGEYFPDPRLQQLFGRYATYVGSSPYIAPATLMLIAHVEQTGVWFVEGGMRELAVSMSKLAKAQGTEIRYNAALKRIATGGGTVTSVELEDGQRLEAERIVYCGDPSWLSAAVLGSAANSMSVVPRSSRSLSAITWTGRAKTKGFKLKRHNVFFSADYQREFEQIFRDDKVPEQPTVYVCAQDRESGGDLQADSPERILCLINAPAFGDHRRLNEEELSICEERTFSQLQQCGLDVDRKHGQFQITQPADFETLFPGSGGTLYGRASHGWMASFARPGTRTKIPGLYLAGGNVHPGAGVPMAALSGMLAAEQIIADRALT